MEPKLKLLEDGGEAFSAILGRIRKARKSIYINMFIWRDDMIGNLVAKELLKAAKRGVKIKISKDILGSVFEKSEETKKSFFHKEFSWRMWYKHKLIEWFYPKIGKGTSKQQPSRLSEALLDNPNISVELKIKGDHSKFFIFDDRYIITGGMNIEDRTIKGDINGVFWNDYMVQIEGDVKNFKEHLRGRKENPLFIMNRARFEIKPILIDMLKKAKKRVYIEMAYIGDKDITHAIIQAANRGVDVQINMSYRTNVQPDLNQKVLSFIKDKAPVRIFLSKNMLHTKMMIIDDTVTLGSANVNRQGLKKLSELNILTSNKRFYNKILKNFSARHSICDEITEIRYNDIRAYLESLI